MFSCVLWGIFLTGALSAAVNRRQLTVTQCQTACPAIYSPVCASNGQTYSNMCMLQSTACVYQMSGLTLSLVHSGPCDTGVVIVTAQPVHDARCDQICDEEVQPVCGSNNVVYSNQCLFDRAACEAAKNGNHLYIIAHSDICPTPKAPNCEQYHIDLSDLAVEDGANLQQMCPSTYHYVCGSNHQTFLNECQMCRYMETNNQEDLMIAYDGACVYSASSGLPIPGGIVVNPIMPIVE